MLCTSDAEDKVSFMAKYLILQEITTTLWENTRETAMYFDTPSSYNVVYMDAKSVVMKKIGKDASGYNGDRAGRQHPAITLC